MPAGVVANLQSYYAGGQDGSTTILTGEVWCQFQAHAMLYSRARNNRYTLVVRQLVAGDIIWYNR